MALADQIIRRITRRPPDIVIGGDEQPYLRRWHVLPRNRFFNIYLHQFLRSDDDRALHDHPWVNVSILLKGHYVEHLPGDDLRFRSRGQVIFRRSGKISHRIEIITGIPVWTLFITGPRYRMWGFHCPQGWKPYYEFLEKYEDAHSTKGCNDD